MCTRGWYQDRSSGAHGSVPGVCGSWVVPGGVYRVRTQPVSLARLGARLVLPGPNPLPGPRFCARPGTPGPCQGPPHTWSPRTQYSPWEPNRARFSSKYPKVSINLRVSPVFVHEACHSPYIKKHGPNVTTLNSQISKSGSLLSQGINGPKTASAR